MSDISVEGYVNRITNAPDVATVDAAFDEIGKLSASDRKRVIDAVEKKAVQEITRGMSGPEMAQIRMVIELMEELKDTPQGKLMKAQFEQADGLDEGLAIAQVFLNLHREKGEGADPVVKAYVEEAAKLTDEEFHSTFGLLKIAVSTMDRAQAENKPAPPANPFRKNAGSKGFGL
jgi:hypothetical protein